MATTPVFQVDAFATRPFEGNPAGVCLLSDERPAEWMHNVAREMMAAATAFVITGTNPLRLRWFTPATELSLCGHATLATAHILWEEGLGDSGRPILFETKSGRLTAERRDDLIDLNFPSEPPAQIAADPDLLRALGVDVVNYVGRNRMDLLVEVQDEGIVRALRPDLATLVELDARGVIVTGAGGEDFDFVSRFFAPAIGVPEDSVTGSAHCCLGPFWAERLGRSRLRAYQASSRGGEIRISVREDRTTLGGRAVTVTEGTLVI